MPLQNWNSLLRYIKRKLGVPINMLEFSDDDLYEIISEDVLPALSQYVGAPIWILIPADNFADTTEAENPNTFIIPVPAGVILCDVVEAYWPSEETPLAVYGGMMNILDPRDVVMANQFVDMMRSLGTAQSFRFLPPNKISFAMPMNISTAGIIIEAKAVHSDLSTIPGDIYHNIFRDWCLAEVKENVAANRDKYESLTAPFGTIALNWQKLIDDAEKIKTQLQEKLQDLPPDILVSFIN